MDKSTICSSSVRSVELVSQLTNPLVEQFKGCDSQRHTVEHFPPVLVVREVTRDRLPHFAPGVLVIGFGMVGEKEYLLIVETKGPFPSLAPEVVPTGHRGKDKLIEDRKSVV